MPPITPHTTERIRAGEDPSPPGRAPAAGDADVEAQISHGRWVALCPCGSAQIPPLTEQRFVCLTCRNASIGGRARRLVWPADPDAVELVLLARPDHRTRNWQPHETIADLELENQAHGLPSEIGALIATPDGLVDRL
jgi:hypothetical protein